MDEEFVYTFRGVTYLYWRDDSEFALFIHASQIIKRILAAGDIKWPKSYAANKKKNPDYTLLDVIKNKMKGKKRPQYVFKSTVALFYDKVPGILPSVEECLNEDLKVT